MPATFQFPEIKTEKLDNFNTCTLFDRLKNQKFYDADHDKLLMTSMPKNNIGWPRFGNGLLGTIFEAYSEHVPLSLRADDLWLAIILNFGRYVKSNSQELRHLFVDHEGRKQLVVKTESPYMEYTTEAHWESLINLMADEIKKNTKDELVDWMTPTFSTTTKKDKMVAQVALMSTVNDYFAMKWDLACGLTQVTLEGTLEDWQHLYTKAEGLIKYGVQDLTNWANLLLPVLAEFVNAFQGKVNQDFWQRICTSKRRGSGGQQNLRGWFLVFAPFDDKGRYRLETLENVLKDHNYGTVSDNDICDCALDLQVTVDDHLKKNHHVVFYAGLLATYYDVDKNVLSPTVDWIMIEKKEITLIDLQEKLTLKLKSEDEQVKQACHNLLLFAHKVAIHSNFPNEKLMDLIDTIESYKWMKLNQVLKSNLYKDFLNFLVLADPKPFGDHRNIFSKYIDPAQLDQLLTLAPN